MKYFRRTFAIPSILMSSVNAKRAYSEDNWLKIAAYAAEVAAFTSSIANVLSEKSDTANEFMFASYGINAFAEMLKLVFSLDNFSLSKLSLLAIDVADMLCLSLAEPDKNPFYAVIIQVFNALACYASGKNDLDIALRRGKIIAFGNLS